MRRGSKGLAVTNAPGSRGLGVTVDNSYGVASTAPVVVTVPLVGSKISYAAARSDGADLRVFDSNRSTALGFALQGWKNAAAYLAEIKQIAIPAPNVEASWVKVGLLGATQAIVFSSGTDLATYPYTGIFVAQDTAGNQLWTYASANTSYAMGIDIGDLEIAGGNAVAVGFQYPDSCAAVLNYAGVFQWGYNWPNALGEYVRVAKIGKMTADAGNQVVFAGSNGRVVLLTKTGTLLWTKILGTHTVQCVDIRDTNGDGQNEIICAANCGIYKLDNTGTALSGWPVILDVAPNWVYSMAVGQITSAAGLQVAAAVSGTNPRVVCLDQFGATLWTYSVSPGLGVDGFSPSTQVNVTCFDLDGDGLDEVIVSYIHYSAAGTALPNVGVAGVSILGANGNLLADAQVGSMTGNVETGDINGDGRREILLPGMDGYVHILQAIKTTPGDLSLVQVVLPTLAAAQRNTFLTYGSPAAVTHSDPTAVVVPAYSFVGANGSHPTGWTDKEGTWTIQNNAFVSTDDWDTGESYSELSTPSFANFALTVDCWKNGQGTHGAGDYYFGLVYRVQSWTGSQPTGYLLQIGSKHGGCQLLRLTAGNIAESVLQLPLGTLPTLSATDKLSLRLRIIGAVHQVDYSINGAAFANLMAVRDPTGAINTAGTIALYNSRGQTTYNGLTAQSLAWPVFVTVT